MMPQPVRHASGNLLAVGLAVVLFVVGVAGVARLNRPIHLSADGPSAPRASLPNGVGDEVALTDSAPDLPSSPMTTGSPWKRFKRSPQADRLYRTAQETMLRGDVDRAIVLFDQVTRRFPGTPYATSALYYRAFLHYRRYRPGDPGPLRLALVALRQLRREYPNAPQGPDARTLETRICGELAQLGDPACRRQVVIAAEPLHIWAKAVPRHKGSAEGAGNGKAGLIFTFDSEQTVLRMAGDAPCQNDKQVDERIAALNSLWKVDPTQAMQVTGQVLSDRDQCLTRLRSQAVLILSQRSTPVMAMAPVVFDAARNDPAQDVRQLARAWLLSQQWAPQTVAFLHSVLDDSNVKETAR